MEQETIMSFMGKILCQIVRGGDNVEYKKALKLRTGDRVINKKTGEIMTIEFKATKEGEDYPIFFCCYGEISGHVLLNHKKLWTKKKNLKKEARKCV